MQNVFIIKTDSDSVDFQKKIGKFLTKHCKDTDTKAAIFELNMYETEKVEAIISNK
ncbi:hypothetical protein KHA94_09100 [Bacillus sp. FJAT-49705]|uniref:Uncharacterized protein n=1 Tax=Cytobacillus citreus TaxID=2833586 RepID=A0ABS5NRB3_9BACI|nr:hypothetical protein [Cytobacillus citreus]MBS4190357.1 hypothetical protein [Cytobacillus citreus]